MKSKLIVFLLLHSTTNSIRLRGIDSTDVDTDVNDAMTYTDNITSNQQLKVAEQEAKASQKKEEQKVVYNEEQAIAAFQEKSMEKADVS